MCNSENFAPFRPFHPRKNLKVCDAFKSLLLSGERGRIEPKITATSAVLDFGRFYNWTGDGVISVGRPDNTDICISFCKTRYLLKYSLNYIRTTSTVYTRHLIRISVSSK